LFVKNCSDAVATGDFNTMEKSTNDELHTTVAIQLN
ncbi:hypothetical protein T03_8240, partial [Trichinella britovi]